MVQSARRPEILFVVLAASIYMAALMSFAHSASTTPLSRAFALDLALTVPLLAYLLPVRRAGWPLYSLPVLALLGAGTVLLFGPAGISALFGSPEVLLIGLECTLLGSVVIRAARAWRRSSATADPLERLRNAAREVVPLARAADMVAQELAVIHYAILSWRAPTSVPVGARAFSYHRRSGYGGLVFALLVLSVGEGAAVHLLLAGWSEIAAWGATLLTLYGALWLVADYRASVLRPVLLTPELLRVRTGLRWSVEVPRSQLARVQRTRPAAMDPVLEAVLVGSPTLWIELRDPVVAQGPFGVTRVVRWIALAVDAPDQLTTALESGAAEDAGDRGLETRSR